jgi:hypothetical protein
LPPQAGEYHSREFIEHCFRPDEREVIVDALALIGIPFQEASNGTVRIPLDVNSGSGGSE